MIMFPHPNYREKAITFEGKNYGGTQLPESKEPWTAIREESESPSPEEMLKKLKEMFEDFKKRPRWY